VCIWNQDQQKHSFKHYKDRLLQTDLKTEYEKVKKGPQAEKTLPVKLLDLKATLKKYKIDLIELS